MDCEIPIPTALNVISLSNQCGVVVSTSVENYFINLMLKDIIVFDIENKLERVHTDNWMFIAQCLQEC